MCYKKVHMTETANSTVQFTSFLRKIINLVNFLWHLAHDWTCLNCSWYGSCVSLLNKLKWTPSRPHNESCGPFTDLKGTPDAFLKFCTTLNWHPGCLSGYITHASEPVNPAVLLELPAWICWGVCVTMCTPMNSVSWEVRCKAFQSSSNQLARFFFVFFRVLICFPIR